MVMYHPFLGALPPANPKAFARIAINNFATRTLVLQRFFLPPPPFVFGTVFSYLFAHTYPSQRIRMGEVILNLVLSHTHTHTHTQNNGVRASAVQEIRLQNYLSGESFSPCLESHNISFTSI
jgi:hypothetical protein